MELDFIGREAFQLKLILLLLTSRKRAELTLS